MCVKSILLLVLRLKIFQNPAQMLGMRQHYPIVKNGVPTIDEKRWKTFDVEIAQGIGMIFDVQPDKTGIWKLSRDLLETKLIFATGIAPFGTKADY